jgi:hypothetical protein
MKRWLEVATSRPVVTRALQYAVIVGAVLIFINHGDAILGGGVSGARVAKMVLTAFVPYAVSTASSVSAILETQTDRG